MSRERRSYEEGYAAALRAGTDLVCVDSAPLAAAVRSGLLPDTALDGAVRRVLRARFRSGHFDAPGAVPWHRIPHEVVGCAAHHGQSQGDRSGCVTRLVDGKFPLDSAGERGKPFGPKADERSGPA